MVANPYCFQPTQAAPPSINAISAFPNLRASIIAPSEVTGYRVTSTPVCSAMKSARA